MLIPPGEPRYFATRSCSVSVEGEGDDPAVQLVRAVLEVVLFRLQRTASHFSSLPALKGEGRFLSWQRKNFFTAPTILQRTSRGQRTSDEFEEVSNLYGSAIYNETFKERMQNAILFPAPKIPRRREVVSCISSTSS